MTSMKCVCVSVIKLDYHGLRVSFHKVILKRKSESDSKVVTHKQSEQ